MRPGQVAERLRVLANQQGRTIEELRTHYMMESFLVRLQRTKYANDFVLKGGVLLAAFRLPRPVGLMASCRLARGLMVGVWLGGALGRGDSSDDHVVEVGECVTQCVFGFVCDRFRR